jgi:hypothetical protein
MRYMMLVRSVAPRDVRLQRSSIAVRAAIPRCGTAALSTWTSYEGSRNLHSAESFLYLVSGLISAFGDLLLELHDLLLNIGSEVGYVKQPANFHH